MPTPPTLVTPNPFVMKDATVTLGTNNYKAAVSSAALTPSSSVATFKGLAPTASYSAGTNATWTLDLTFAQSFGANDLSTYLFNNEGTEVAFTLEPVAGGAGFTGIAIITPGAVGGAVDAYGTATVSLGVKGKPTLVPAP